MSSDQEVLTPKEVCEILQIHKTTLYKLLGRGAIPSFRIGSEWRFHKDSVLRWMTAGGAASTNTKGRRPSAS